MGYPTGFIAQVAALALACHAMRTEQKLARTAFLAGFAAGFAVWSHPIFGTVALLALIAPTLYRWRALRPVVAAARGRRGARRQPVAAVHGAERLAGVGQAHGGDHLLGAADRFVTELLPRAFGLRTPTGDWVGPEAVAVGVAAVLIIVVVGRDGGRWWCSRAHRPLPILVAGLLAFPVLALYAPLGSVADARYAMPFLPQLLMGLGAWLLLVPERIRKSPWLVVTVPTVWALMLSVPVIHQQVGWQWLDPDADAKQVVSEIESRQIPYVAGDYWGAYLVDYLAGGRLQAATHGPVRLEDQNATVDAADPSQVAFVYQDGHDPVPADAGGPVPVGERRTLGSVPADRVSPVTGSS